LGIFQQKGTAGLRREMKNFVLLKVAEYRPLGHTRAAIKEMDKRLLKELRGAGWEEFGAGARAENAIYMTIL